MSTQYNIYKNDGSGGPVDYTSIVATVSALTYSVGPLAYGGDTTFAIRAVDTVSGLEETNADARVRILVGSTGVDLAGLPNAPTQLRATPTAGGGMRLSWAYSARGQGAPPTGFHVYYGTPTVSYGSVAATVAYSPSALFYSTTLPGLTGGSSYQFAVRAYNASGEEPNAVVAVAVAATSGPNPVSDLAATLLS